jgi:hypothetical protein
MYFDDVGSTGCSEWRDGITSYVEYCSLGIYESMERDVYDM